MCPLDRKRTRRLGGGMRKHTRKILKGRGWQRKSGIVRPVEEENGSTGRCTAEREVAKTKERAYSELDVRLDTKEGQRLLLIGSAERWSWKGCAAGWSN